MDAATRCILVVSLIIFAIWLVGKSLSLHYHARTPPRNRLAVQIPGAYHSPKLKLRPHGSPSLVNGVEDILSMSPPQFDIRYKNPCWWRNDARLKCLPYFHIIGVCKSGTSDLFMRLIAHPQILPSYGFNGKETHYWSWRRFRFDIFTNAGRYLNYSSYVDTFDTVAEALQHKSFKRPSKLHSDVQYITGESSPTTFWDLTGWNKIPQNTESDPVYTTPHCIYHIQPSQKLILILRNPTERLYSDYMFLYQTHKSRDDFHDRVVHEIHKFTVCRAKRTLRSCLFDRTMHIDAKVRLQASFYAEYLKEWVKVFRPEQLLVIRTEDYGSDVAGHVKNVFRYLTVDEISEADLKKISEKRKSFVRSASDTKLGDMRDDTRALLDRFFEPYNMELASILKDKKFTWSNSSTVNT